MAPSPSDFSDYSGIPIEELIANPLIAAARAQNEMAREELRALLRTCFQYEDGVYEPIMIEMTLTRGVVEQKGPASADVTLEQIQTTFSVPLITLFPFASLGIDSVDVELDFEVTAQYEVEPEAVASGAQAGCESSEASPSRPNQVMLLGGLVRDQVTDSSVSSSANYSVNVHAGSLPLTSGMKMLIDLYTKSIVPVEEQEGVKN